MSSSTVHSALAFSAMLVLGGLAPAQDAARPENYCFSVPYGASIGGTDCFAKGAIMGWSGSVQVSMNDFTLVVSDALPGAKGMFLYGMEQQRLPFGNGYLCIAPPVHRLPGLVTVPDDGIATYPLDLSADANAMFAAGTTWNFQFWYREERTFNLSDGLRVPFAR
ncbi:MAG TPA: hypothetical protein VMS76_00765 [Planctomycetota bacterium]|nr:hypothetical protein [Planctomycetota bacterium]